LVLLDKILAKGSNIIDSHYANNSLILLDKNNGLLYYRRSNNKFIPDDNLSIELDEEIEYSSIEVWKNTTFIAIDAETESFVVELQNIYNKVYLVRYFKGYD
jgi:hypothetical protein